MARPASVWAGGMARNAPRSVSPTCEAQKTVSAMIPAVIGPGLSPRPDGM